MLGAFIGYRLAGGLFMLLPSLLSPLAVAATIFQSGVSGGGPTVDPGSLRVLNADGHLGVACPLAGTQVNAKVEGFGARVVVVQTFSNPSAKPIEAVYTFPLPDDSAVDGMRMVIGDRVITGIIKEKAEARATYEKAKSEGKSTALLDQERPNVFTQRVANIPARSKIQVALTYVQLLKFENDGFEFHFPMTVGPRYTDATTPDPQKVTPPIVPAGTRSGAGIRLNVEISAGAPITSIDSVLHKVEIKRISPDQAEVQLANRDEIPNRDFILRYGVAADTVVGSLLTTRDPKRGGFFTLILMPPKTPKAGQIAPKEAIFVIDQSGSQSGFPIQKSKELTKKLIAALNPNDTFNVINFSNEAVSLWPRPRPNTAENRRLATAYVDKLDANGGTELWKAVVASLSPAPDRKRPRIVVFNTDGFIGGEARAIEEVQRHRGNARMFTFGIGNSVNRYLINAMSAEGRGDSEMVTLNADSDGAVGRFVQRTDDPVLTDISMSFSGVDVKDVLPRNIPNVFSAKPVIIKGRYDKPGSGTVLVTGKLGGKPWIARYPVEFPRNGNSGSAIVSLWAREKVNDLETQQRLDSEWRQKGTPRPKSYWDNAITKLGLDFSLMTAFTSFVAVDDRVVNPGGNQATIQVPVEMADGVSYQKVFAGVPPGNFAGQGASKLAPATTVPLYGVGDPLLQVDAPSDSKVIAIFPGGELKPLRWNDAARKWEVRFDIPASFRQGQYSVRVQIVNRDGTRRQLDVPFEVAMVAPALVATAKRLPDGTLEISVPTSERWARIALLTPGGERLPFEFDAKTGTTRVRLAAFKEGWYRVIGTDRAHNLAEVRIRLNAQGQIVETISQP